MLTIHCKFFLEHLEVSLDFTYDRLQNVQLASTLKYLPSKIYLANTRQEPYSHSSFKCPPSCDTEVVLTFRQLE